MHLKQLSRHHIRHTIPTLENYINITRTTPGLLSACVQDLQDCTQCTITSNSFYRNRTPRSWNSNSITSKEKKPFHVSWGKSLRTGSRTQWKGRGIDGGVNPRTGVSGRIALAHRADTRPDCAWWGNVAPACFEGCVSWWTRSGIL